MNVEQRNEINKAKSISRRARTNKPPNQFYVFSPDIALADAVGNMEPANDKSRRIVPPHGWKTQNISTKTNSGNMGKTDGFVEAGER
jgi:hypothetical protein